MTTMGELVGQLPDQLRWTAASELPTIPTAPSAIVAGMGGSGIAGDVACVVADRFGKRVAVHKDYDLPGWSDGTQLVVVVSHSGNTEETVAVTTAALSAGHPIVAVTTGGELAARARVEGFPLVSIPPGPQPRAAFGYLVGAVLRVLASAALVDDQRAGLEEGADVAESLIDGDGPAMADEIAETLAGRFTVIYGGRGIPGVAAYRWKTQINENAKAPAARVLLPEGDHNDIVGWGAYRDLSRDGVGAVFLSDSRDHPRVTTRSHLTQQLMAASTAVVGEIDSQGAGTIARLFSLTVVGDLVSVALAARSGVDPMPVGVIEDLKKRLAQESS